MRNLEQHLTRYVACHRDGRRCADMKPAFVDDVAGLAIGQAVAARDGVSTGSLRS